MSLYVCIGRRSWRSLFAAPSGVAYRNRLDVVHIIERPSLGGIE